LPKKNAPT